MDRKLYPRHCECEQECERLFNPRDEGYHCIFYISKCSHEGCEKIFFWEGPDKNKDFDEGLNTCANCETAVICNNHLLRCQICDDSLSILCEKCSLEFTKIFKSICENCFEGFEDFSKSSFHIKPVVKKQ